LSRGRTIRSGEVDVQVSTSEVLSLDDMIGDRPNNVDDDRGSNDRQEGRGYAKYPPILTLAAGEEEIEKKETVRMRQDHDNASASFKKGKKRHHGRPSMIRCQRIMHLLMQLIN
jgi:hypothetical protein